jgi:hypothetical protein
VGLLGRGSNGAGGGFSSFYSVRGGGKGGSGGQSAYDSRTYSPDGVTPYSVGEYATATVFEIGSEWTSGPGRFGAGGAGGSSSTFTQGRMGADGAVRIVWPGDTRTFPSTDVGTP